MQPYVKRKFLLYCIYVAGIIVACTSNNWLFCVLFSLTGVLCLFKNEYTKYLVYSFTVYLVAYNSRNILCIPLLLGIYMTSEEKLRFDEKLVPYVLALIFLVLFQLNLGYVVLPLYIFYLFRKYDSRILVGCAIVLLTVAASFLTVSNEKAANTVAIYSYYFLVLGVLGELVEELRCKKSADGAVNQSTEND